MKSIVDEALSFMLFITRHVRSGDPDKAILALLVELGFQSHLDGFVYLRRAIYLKYRHPEMHMSDIYLDILKLSALNLNANQIDQAIRGAIEIAWKDCDLEKWALVLPVKKNRPLQKPSNLIFVAQMASIIELWQSQAKEVVDHE